MAKGYRPVRRDEPFLLPPDMRDWLPDDHPVHLVIAVVDDHLDTSALHAGRRTGGAGTAGYDPDMLVTVLVWAYAHGVTSSRRIEELGRPAFSGQRNWSYFMLHAAGSGTRRGPLAESGSRVPNGDGSDYSGARCTAQYLPVLS